jgi:hypothetical protein
VRIYLLRALAGLTAAVILLSGCVDNGGEADDPPSQTSSQSAPESAVAILVVDDFHQEIDVRDERAPVTASTNAPSGNCAYTQDGERWDLSGAGNVFGSGGGGAGPSYPEPHGYLVYQHLQDRIGVQFPGAVPQSTSIGTGRSEVPLSKTWRWPGPSPSASQVGVHLLGIDTQAYDTATITTRLREHVRWLTSDMKISKIVINMSFLIMPCDLTTTMTAYLDKLQQDPQTAALMDLLNVFPGLSRDQLPEALLYDPAFGAHRLAAVYPTRPGGADWIFNDDLRRFLIDIGSTAEVVPVAAAGNAGMRYPFAPAIWHEVVSVSAKGRAYDANPGEVIAADELLYTDGSTTTPFYGTSFAAPNVSAKQGEWLLRPGATITCEGNSGSSRPPLGYSTSNSGPWLNKSLTDAAAEYCEGFPAVP